MGGTGEIRLAFIGTGTCNSAWSTPQSIAIGDGSSIVMVDAGGGFYHGISRLGSRFFRYDMIDAVLLTHYHVDHVSGLPDCIWGEMWDARRGRERPLVIAGPPGLDRFMEKRFYPFIGDYEIPFAIEPVVIGPGESREIGFLSVTSCPLAHGETATGYRIGAGGAVLAVTGDTGYCDALPVLLGGADAAVIEWSFTDTVSRPRHLCTGDILRLLDAGVFPPRVFVLHIYPDRAMSRDDQVQNLRELLGDDAERFVFPRGGEIVGLA